MMRTILAIGLCLTCLLTALDVMARRVVQPVERSENATMAEALSAAREAGFVQALLAESLDMLPGPLDPTRQVLLEEFLKTRAGKYVLSYQELGQVAGADGLGLELSVNLNRQALKQDLKDLGVYYTTANPLPFSLELGDGPADELAKVSLLQALSGLRTEEGSEPRLSLSYGGDAWIGRLTSGATEYLARHEKLEDLWMDLWGRYFSRSGDSLVEKHEAGLSVSGWFAPDGVEQFDQMLRGWTDAVDEARLKDLNMGVEGIEANWVLALKSRPLLVERLEAYLPARQLRYELQGDATIGQEPGAVVTP